MLYVNYSSVMDGDNKEDDEIGFRINSEKKAAFKKVAIYWVTMIRDKKGLKLKVADISRMMTEDFTRKSNAGQMPDFIRDLLGDTPAPESPPPDPPAAKKRIPPKRPGK